MYTEDDKFLGTAKKRVGNLTSNYMICTSKEELDVSSKGYVGKIRSNFMGTVFNVFDDGPNPTSDKCIKDHEDPRELTATITYKSNPHFEGYPREIEVYLIKQGHSYADLTGAQRNTEEIDLSSLYDLN